MKLEDVASELREVARNLPSFELDGASLRTTRQMFAEQAASCPPDDAAPVNLRKIMVPGFSEGPPVAVAVYEPVGPSNPRAVVLDIHGGGFVFGTAAMNDTQNRRLARELNVTVASVEYRLAPEHRYPASLEDCIAAVRWIRSAAELSPAAERTLLLGNSAGGGLAASLSLWLRDQGEALPIAQILLSPMLDDRTCSIELSSASPHVAWTSQNNRFGWESLLGSSPGKADVSHFASPARSQSLQGLPPTFISVGSVDLFANENVDFARHLMGDNVPIELHVYPGAFHGFVRFAPEAHLSRRCIADYLSAIDRYLEV